MTNEQQSLRFEQGQGFIAALDQSGGSTPKALAQYGVPETAYSNEDEMYALIHEARSRIMTSPVFDSKRIIGAILFENTLDREIEGVPSAKYLWETKNIVPILKIDKGLAEKKDDAQLMKDIPGLDELLARAKAQGVYGTKERSVIYAANPASIKAVVDQQFELAERVLAAGLVPIVEPEVNIDAPDKAEAEALLKAEILAHLDQLDGKKVALKLTIPDVDNFYRELIEHPAVARVVALSGGYPRDEANDRLSRNNGLIASFSRALLDGLTASQSDEDFNSTLDATIEGIYQASLT
ncbi:MAG: fructose bisphosphate aldolase [Ancrocorticia sp.]